MLVSNALHKLACQKIYPLTGLWHLNRTPFFSEIVILSSPIPVQSILFKCYVPLIRLDVCNDGQFKDYIKSKLKCSQVLPHHCGPSQAEQRLRHIHALRKPSSWADNRIKLGDIIAESQTIT